jgi:small subunit ribosomal protein S21
MRNDRMNDQDYDNFKKKGLRVEVRNNNVTKAWRKLKRLLQSEGVNLELRRRQYYEKPSERRRREKDMARKRWIKKKAEIENKW